MGKNRIYNNLLKQDWPAFCKTFVDNAKYCRGQIINRPAKNYRMKFHGRKSYCYSKAVRAVWRKLSEKVMAGEILSLPYKLGMIALVRRKCDVIKSNCRTSLVIKKPVDLKATREFWEKEPDYSPKGSKKTAWIYLDREYYFDLIWLCPDIEGSKLYRFFPNYRLRRQMKAWDRLEDNSEIVAYDYDALMSRYGSYLEGIEKYWQPFFYKERSVETVHTLDPEFKAIEKHPKASYKRKIDMIDNMIKNVKPYKKQHYNGKDD